jgi:hypothetical protein
MLNILGNGNFDDTIAPCKRAFGVPGQSPPSLHTLTHTTADTKREYMCVCLSLSLYVCVCVFVL